MLERLEKLCVLHLSAPARDAVRFVIQPTVEGSVAAYAHLKPVRSLCRWRDAALLCRKRLLTVDFFLGLGSTLAVPPL